MCTLEALQVPKPIAPRTAGATSFSKILGIGPATEPVSVSHDLFFVAFPPIPRAETELKRQHFFTETRPDRRGTTKRQQTNFCTWRASYETESSSI